MGQITDLASTILANQSNPLPSSGLISNLPMRILLILNGARKTYPSSHPLWLQWSLTAFSSVLSFYLNETPTAFPSSDPILKGFLFPSVYQGSLPIFGTPALWFCTSFITVYGGSGPVHYQEMHWQALNDLDDGLWFRISP